MPVYPIRVPGDNYRGSNPSRRRKSAEFNRIAEKIEEHLNYRVTESSEPTQVFIYGFLAAELGLSERLVREVLAGVGGHTGITIAKEGRDA